MKYLLMTFDLEEFVFPYENRIGFPREKAFEMSRVGLVKILRLLRKFKVRSTFFTTYEFAIRYPRLIKKLIEENHELAFHGKSHMDYSVMPADEIKKEFSQCISELEKIFSVKLIGFRATRFRSINCKTLAGCGFRYDSSSHPTIIPPNRASFGERKMHVKKGVTVIPVSVTRFRLPVSWFFVRNLPLGYLKAATSDILGHSDYLMLYFHPWDFYDLEKIKFKGIYWQLYKRNSGVFLERKIKNYLHYIGRNINKTTVIGYLQNNNCFQDHAK